MDFLEIELAEHEYLYVQQSGIAHAGQGLFTAIKIFKHEIIAIYKGEELSEQEIINRSAENKKDYFMHLLNGGILDCANTECFAKFANDQHNQPKLNNAMITINDNEEICLVAIRNIQPNSEIFCSYGKYYWTELESH